MLDKLNYGDIVTVKNYDGYYFRIVGKQTQHYEYEGEPDETDYMLDLVCAHTEGEALAFIEDITLVAVKDDADAYLQGMTAPTEPPNAMGIIFTVTDEGFTFEDGSTAQAAAKSAVPTKAQRQARIDTLLDERNAVADIDFVEDASRAARYAEIDAEIAKEAAG